MLFNKRSAWREWTGGRWWWGGTTESLWKRGVRQRQECLYFQSVVACRKSRRPSAPGELAPSHNETLMKMCRGCMIMLSLRGDLRWGLAGVWLLVSVFKLSLSLTWKSLNVLHSGHRAKNGVLVFLWAFFNWWNVGTERCSAEKLCRTSVVYDGIHYLILIYIYTLYIYIYRLSQC